MDLAKGVEGKVVLVTGGGSGLGRHFAQLLARCGADVIITGRHRHSLDTVAAPFLDAGRMRAITMDVTDAGSVEAGIAEAGQGRGIDILVNNAGISIAKSALELDAEEWDAVVDTNLKGCFIAARAVARQMIGRQRGGSIVNIASVLGQRVAGHVSAYAASKAGLIQLTKSLALELARHDIRVNALCPGYFETDLNRDFLASAAGQAMVNRIPQRRPGRPDELDGPLLLLAGPAGAYITGATLAVDGGHLVSSL